MNRNIAQQIEITSQLRRIPTDHIAAIAESQLRVGGERVYTFKDASQGKFVVERDERGRGVFRFAVIA